jgi:hypothetical protein
MAVVGDLFVVVAIAYSQYSRNPLIAVVGGLLGENDSHSCYCCIIVRRL